MSAGFGQGTRESVDSALGSLMLQLNQTMNKIVSLYQYINGLGSAGLQALPSVAATPVPYNSTDAGKVINAITDAYHLCQIYVGAAYLTAGATANAATYTVANNTTTFGYNFQVLNIGQTFGTGQ